MPHPDGRPFVAETLQAQKDRIEALEAALRPFAALIHRPWETHGSCHQAVSYDDVVRAAELLKLEV